MLGSPMYKCSSRGLEDKGSLKWLCKPTFMQQKLCAKHAKLFVVSVYFKKVFFLSSMLELDSRLIFFNVG